MVIPLTYGRLGNFLFQAAAAISYAWKHGLEFTLPSTTQNPKINPIYLQHLVNKRYNPRLPRVTLVEGPHTYQELEFKPQWKDFNIVLDGYWQTEKYFVEYREELISAFGFPWKAEPLVSVHVRRTDYLTLTQKHPPVSKQWIENAMSRFLGARFLFFSDDLPWCVKEFGERLDVAFAPGKDPIEDLVLMSQCSVGHVCSASTFSWWGAWLNRNLHKLVIMPKHWFMPGRKEDTRDIVPEHWERL